MALTRMMYTRAKAAMDLPTWCGATNEIRMLNHLAQDSVPEL